MEKFSSILHLIGNNTGIVVPPQVIDALGGGKKPKVSIVVNGFAYRSTVAVMDGKYLISLSAERRTAAGLKGGDPIEVTLELDTAPREVDVPPALAEALAHDTKAKAFFESLSYSQQLKHVLAISDAKTDETRAKRIAKAMEMLREGKK